MNNCTLSHGFFSFATINRFKSAIAMLVDGNIIRKQDGKCVFIDVSGEILAGANAIDCDALTIEIPQGKYQLNADTIEGVCGLADSGEYRGLSVVDSCELSYQHWCNQKSTSLSSLGILDAIDPNDDQEDMEDLLTGEMTWDSVESKHGVEIKDMLCDIYNELLISVS